MKVAFPKWRRCASPRFCWIASRREIVLKPFFGVTFALSIKDINYQPLEAPAREPKGVAVARPDLGAVV